MFFRCDPLSSLLLSLSSAVVVFQVLTAAVGICSADSTVTPTSTTVRTTTKPKPPPRFAKRTPWSSPTRSREYEEDSRFDFEYRELLDLWKNRLELNLLGEGSAFLFWFVTHWGHFPRPVHERSHIFSALFSFGCESNTFQGVVLNKKISVWEDGFCIFWEVTEGGCWRKIHGPFSVFLFEKMLLAVRSVSWSSSRSLELCLESTLRHFQAFVRTLRLLLLLADGIISAVACSLLAWVAKWIYLSPPAPPSFFVFSASTLTLWAQSWTLPTCQTFASWWVIINLMKMLLCAAGISSTLARLRHTAQTCC